MPGIRDAQRIWRRFLPDKLMRQHAVPRTASLFGLLVLTTAMAVANSAANLGVRNRTAMS